MRNPTSKEKFVMTTAVDGLKADIEALCNHEVNSDVLGTMGVNLAVLARIRDKLMEEREEGACPSCS